jgi:hypothetical protein
MNTNFPDLHQQAKAPHAPETTHLCVFDLLRRRLSEETPCRNLSDLIESVNAMQRARNIPEEFDLRFEEFVYRSENYTAAVRPSFPTLVSFLSSREGSEAADQRKREASPGRESFHAA